MDVLFLLLLVLATPSVLASMLLWACLLMAARADVLTPPLLEWE